MTRQFNIGIEEAGERLQARRRKQAAQEEARKVPCYYVALVWKATGGERGPGRPAFYSRKNAEAELEWRVQDDREHLRFPPDRDEYVIKTDRRLPETLMDRPNRKVRPGDREYPTPADFPA